MHAEMWYSVACESPLAMTPLELTQLGLKAHNEGRLIEARSLYAAALEIEPNFPHALHLMGLLCFAQSEPAAEGWFSKAIEVAPADLLGTAYAGRGEVRLQQRRWEEALQDFDSTIVTGALSAATWNNRGLCLNNLGRLDDALESYRQALMLAPNNGQILNNRGDTLRRLHRFGEAVATFQRCIQFNPSDWGCLHNLAITLAEMGRPNEALEKFNQALTLNPNLPAALQARANLLWKQFGEPDAALRDIDRLVAIAPDFPLGRGNQIHFAMAVARWEGFAEAKAALDAGVAEGKPLIEPYTYLFLSDRPADLQRCARSYAKTMFPPKTPLWKGQTRRPGRIRIGYLCSEFRNHPTLYLTAELWEAHRTDDFEIFAFDSGGGDGSRLRARFDAAVKNCTDIRGLSDHTAATAIRARDIDILVDLNGYSDKLRPGIFAYRPARIQAHYLAYPGTLGASYIDYLLADRVVIPPGHEIFYDEKIVWLPDTYQITDRKREAAITPRRSEAGLPEGAFVFCNFNQLFKLTPDTFSAWMRILKQVPGSILWLLKPSPLGAENLRREAAARGVNPARLVFAERLPFDQHLGRLSLADLSLDGLPYGAHTTASDALWAGVPLITKLGSSFAGRVAASLLHAIGLPELITEGQVDFETLAIELASRPSYLATIRQKLVVNRSTTPLFDTGARVRQLEAAYQLMMQQSVPENFAVRV